MTIRLIERRRIKKIKRRLKLRVVVLVDLKGGGEAQQSSLSATYDFEETFNKTVESLKK
jgi:hypothetical protein